MGLDLNSLMQQYLAGGTGIEERLSEEVRAKLADVAKQTIRLQLDTAGVIADEASRLSSNDAEYEAMRNAIGAYFSNLCLDEARRASLEDVPVNDHQM
jgi:D-aminopeptidase